MYTHVWHKYAIMQALPERWPSTARICILSTFSMNWLFESEAPFYRYTPFPLCGIHSGTGRWMSPLYWCTPDWAGSHLGPVHTHPHLREHQTNWVCRFMFSSPLFFSYLLLHWYFVTAAKRPLTDLWLTAWRNKETLTVWLYAGCWVI